nr:MAG TPA: Protein of unknown function (DUF1642) [Caudoviricetes sp.]
MDRNEAVQKLATAGRLSIAHAEDLYDSCFSKPVVPQYVANWYEEIKGEFYLNLHHLAWDIFESLDENACVPEKALDDDFTRWYRKNKNAIQIIVNMHQFGYEVEKEAKYTVKLKNKAGNEDYLVDTGTQGFRFYNGIYTESRNHTRKELEEADFGWVFDCPGVEVKEVE